MGSHYDASEVVSTATTASPRRGFVMASSAEEVIEVYRAACAAAGVKPISSFMKLLRAGPLQEVVLDHSYFGDRGLPPVLAALRCTQMAVLSLRSCMLSYDHLKPLQRELSGHPYLVELHLLGNQLGLPSAKLLLELIESTPTLVKVAVDAATPKVEYLKQKCLANMNVHIPIATCAACRKSVLGATLENAEMIALKELSRVVHREMPPSPEAMKHVWGYVRESLVLNSGLLTVCDVDCLHDWVADVLSKAETGPPGKPALPGHPPTPRVGELVGRTGEDRPPRCSYCRAVCGTAAGEGGVLADPHDYLLRTLAGELEKLAAPVSASAFARCAELLASFADSLALCSPRCGRSVLRRGLTGGGGLLPLPKDSRDLLDHEFFGVPPTAEGDYVIEDAVPVVDQGELPLSAAVAAVKACEHGEADQLDPFFTYASGVKLLTAGEGPDVGYGIDLRTACRSVVKCGLLPAALSPSATLEGGGGRRGGRFTRAAHAAWLEWSAWAPLRSLNKTAASRRKGAYYLLAPNARSKDLFDAIRSVSWSMFPAKRPIVSGCKWRPAWAHAPNGVIPYTRYKGGLPHAVRIIGQKTIDETLHLIVAPSLGYEAGDRGLFYFPREVVNREFKFGTFVFRDHRVAAGGSSSVFATPLDFPLMAPPAASAAVNGPLSPETQAIVDAQPQVDAVLALLSTPSLRQDEAHRVTFAPLLAEMPREAAFLFRSCSRHSSHHDEERLTLVRRLYTSGCISQIAFFWQCQTPAVVRAWLTRVVAAQQALQRDVRHISLQRKRSEQTFLVRRHSQNITNVVHQGGGGGGVLAKRPSYLQNTSSANNAVAAVMEGQRRASARDMRVAAKPKVSKVDKVKAHENDFVRGLMAAKGLSRFQNLVTMSFSGGAGQGGRPEVVRDSVASGASPTFLQLLAVRVAPRGGGSPDATPNESAAPVDYSLSKTAYVAWGVQVSCVALDPAEPEAARVHLLSEHPVMKHLPFKHSLDAVCYRAPFQSAVAYLFSGGVWCEFDLVAERCVSGPRLISTDMQFRELPVAEGFHAKLTCCVTLPDPAGAQCYFFSKRAAVLWDLRERCVVASYADALGSDGPFSELPPCFAPLGVQGCAYLSAERVYLVSGRWGLLWDLTTMRPALVDHEEPIDTTDGDGDAHSTTPAAPFLLAGAGSFMSTVPGHFAGAHSHFAHRLSHALRARFDHTVLYGSEAGPPAASSPYNAAARLSQEATFATLASLHCNVAAAGCTPVCYDDGDASLQEDVKKTLLRTLVVPSMGFMPYTAAPGQDGVVQYKLQARDERAGAAVALPLVPRPPEPAGSGRGRRRSSASAQSAGRPAAVPTAVELTFECHEPQRFQYVQLVGDLGGVSVTVSACADGMTWRAVASTTAAAVITELAWGEEHMPCKLWRVTVVPRTDAEGVVAGWLHRVHWYTVADRGAAQAVDFFEVAALPSLDVAVAAPLVKSPDCLCPASGVAPQVAEVAWDTLSSTRGWFAKQAILPLLNSTGHPSDAALFLSGTQFLVWSAKHEGPPTAAPPYALTSHDKFRQLPGPLCHVGVDAAVYVSPRTNHGLVYLFCNETVLMWDLQSGAAVGAPTTIAEHEAFKGLPPSFHSGCDTAANLFFNTSDQVAFFKAGTVVYWDLESHQVVLGPFNRASKLASNRHPFGNVPASFDGPSMVVAKLPNASEGFAVFAESRWLHYSVEGSQGEVTEGPHDVFAHRRYIKLPGALSWYCLDKVGYVLIDLKAAPEMFVGVQVVAANALSNATFKAQWSDDNQRFITAGTLHVTDTGRVTWTTGSVEDRSHRFWRLLLWPYGAASLAKVEWLRLPLRTAYALPSAVRTSTLEPLLEDSVSDAVPALRSAEEVEAVFGHTPVDLASAHTLTFNVEEELVFEFFTPFVGAIQIRTNNAYSSWVVSSRKPSSKWTERVVLNVLDGEGQACWDPFDGAKFWRLELAKGSKVSLLKVAVLVYDGPVMTHGSDVRGDLVSQAGLLLSERTADGGAVELHRGESLQCHFRREPKVLSKVLLGAKDQDRPLRGEWKVQASADGVGWTTVCTARPHGQSAELTWETCRPARHWRVRTDTHTHLRTVQWMQPPHRAAAAATPQLARVTDGGSAQVTLFGGEVVSRARPLATLLRSSNLDPVVTLHPGHSVVIKFPDANMYALAGMCFVSVPWDDAAGNAQHIPEEITTGGGGDDAAAVQRAMSTKNVRNASRRQSRQASHAGSDEREGCTAEPQPADYPVVPGLTRLRVELADEKEEYTVAAACHEHTGRASEVHWGPVGACLAVKVTVLPGEPVTLINALVNSAGSVGYVHAVPTGVDELVLAPVDATPESSAEQAPAPPAQPRLAIDAARLAKLRAVISTPPTERPAAAASPDAYLNHGEQLQLTFPTPQKIMLVAFDGHGGALALSMWHEGRRAWVPCGIADPAASTKWVGASRQWRLEAVPHVPAQKRASAAPRQASTASVLPKGATGKKASASAPARVVVAGLSLLAGVMAPGDREVEPAPYVEWLEPRLAGWTKLPSLVPASAMVQDPDNPNATPVDAQFAAAKTVTKKVGKYIKDRKTGIRVNGLDFENFCTTIATPLPFLRCEQLVKLVNVGASALALKEFKLSKALPNPDKDTPTPPKLEYIGTVCTTAGGEFRNLQGSGVLTVSWQANPQALPAVFCVFDVGEEWAPIGTFPACPALLYLLPPVKSKAVLVASLQGLVFSEQAPLTSPSTGAGFTSQRGLEIPPGVSVVAELSREDPRASDPFSAAGPVPRKGRGAEEDAAPPRPPSLRLLDLLLPDEPCLGIFSCPAFDAAKMKLKIQLGMLKFDALGTVAESLDVEVRGGKELECVRVTSLMRWCGLRFRMTGEVVPEDEGALRLTGKLVDGVWEDLHEIGKDATLLDPVMDIHFALPSESPGALGVASAVVYGKLVYSSGVCAKCSVDVASMERLLIAHTAQLPIHRVPQFALLPCPAELTHRSWLTDHIVIADATLRINAASHESATHYRKHSVTGSVRLFSYTGECAIQLGSLGKSATNIVLRATLPDMQLGMLTLRKRQNTSGVAADVLLSDGGRIRLTGSTTLLGLPVACTTLHIQEDRSWFEATVNFGGSGALEAKLTAHGVGPPPQFADFLVKGEFNAAAMQSVLYGLALEVPIMQGIVAAGLLPTLCLDGVHIQPFHLSAPTVCVRLVGIVMGSDFDVFSVLHVDAAQDFLPSAANQIMEQCWEALLALYHEFQAEGGQQGLLENQPVIAFDIPDEDGAVFDYERDW
eukprot:TRINITY_DN4541_c0_g1_i1.p1 TRINITY_DN4541_c0_g1~~TRINITY_DN4541_c0_g1_i1.p1  ORF type:complete len:3252 (+),score=1096.33 TRINITY_DN4541_c0_g1_i1:126-9881(+)